MITNDESPVDGAAWNALTAEWQSSTELPAPDFARVRAAIDAETRRMKLWLTGELALTAIAIAGPLWNVARRPGTQSWLLLADAWLILAIVWVFALLGRRTLWEPAAETSEAYLHLGRRRAQLKVRTTWLALAVLAGQLLAVRVFEGSTSSLQWALAGAWVVWALWLHRRAVLERRRFDTLLGALHGE